MKPALIINSDEILSGYRQDQHHSSAIQNMPHTDGIKKYALMPPTPKANIDTNP